MKGMTAEEGLARVGACLAGGMAVKGWRAANGVAAPTMYTWDRRLREEREADAVPAFVEVVAMRDEPLPAAAIAARVGPVGLIVPPGAAERDLAAAMRAAASL